MTRNRIVQEIVETERDYIISMKCALKYFFEPMTMHTGHENESWTSSTIQTIFSNLQQISSVSEEFYELLTPRLEEWTPCSTIGDVFCQTGFIIKFYVQYHQNFDRAMSVLRSLLSQSRNFKTFHDQCCDELNDKATATFDQTNMLLSEAQLKERWTEHISASLAGSSLVELLTRPCQRMPRYLLFLSGLLKETQWDRILDPYGRGDEPRSSLDDHFVHPDVPFLQKAHQMMSNFAFFIDTSIRKSRSLVRMTELHGCLRAFPGVCGEEKE
eukprot:MONOS_1735.1-p1 / transcript=MONOS_1735.1 / gene=MONOS_1735 / organism=Monocercomonoides_exilis_PA203 / gene_product=unspecified product / transcript_product=unspecified product / location=Mono_scaffold00032:83682-84599(+) / protein_length=270 / sequence_SO=supercontig / SO=protein_coding / is_pseudo=false